MMNVSPTVLRSITSLVFAGCVLAALAVGTARADQADDAYLAAIGLYKQQKWDFAVRAFSDFLKRYPDHPRAESARLFWGLSLTHSGRYDEARQVFREFQRLYPNSRELPQVRYRIGECSYMLDDLPAARRELEDFTRRYPQHALNEWALPYLADTQLRLGDAAAAVQTFRTALKLYPQGKLARDARFGLARALEKAGQLDEATELYRQIVAARVPGYAEKAQLSLAALLMQRGDLAAAAQEFDRFAELFPQTADVPLARLNAGFAYFRMKRYDTAIERFDLAATDARHRTSALYWKGLAYKAAGDCAQAIETFRQAHQDGDRSDEMAGLVYHWADCERRLGNWQTAHDRFAEFLQRWPRHDLADDAVLLAAECLLLAAQTKPVPQREPLLAEAAEEIRRLQARFPRSPLLDYARLVQARVDLASTDRRRWQTALEQLRELAERAPAEHLRWRARYFAVHAAELLGNHQSAVRLAQPLLDALNSGRADAELLPACLMAARSHLALKQFDAARTAAELLLRRFDEQPGERPGNTAAGARGPATGGDLRAEAHALAAIASAESGRWQDAREHWDALTTLEAGETKALLSRTALRLAEAAYAAKRYDDAILWFTAAAEQPDAEHRPQALSGLGWALASAGRYREAAGAFEKLLQTFPEHELAAEAAVKRADCLQAAGDTRVAAEAFRRSFEQLGSHPLAFTSGIRAAELAAQLGQVNDADRLYEQLVARFPEHPRLPQVFHNWAMMNYRAERYERADAIFRRLLEKFPESEFADDARLSLAESDLAAGRIDAASRVLEELSRSPKADTRVRRDALFRLIGVATVKKQWKQVLQLTQRYLAEYADSPDAPEVRMLRAQARFYLGEVDVARNELLELKHWVEQSGANVAGVHPWAPFVWILLAETEFARKDYQQVRRLAAEFSERFPDAAAAFQMDELVGRSYKQQAEFEQAEKYFRRVLDSPHARNTETAARAQYALADMEFLRKRYDRAVSLYLKVYHGFPFPEWQAAALLYAGLCDEQLGRTDDAAKMYALLLQKFPGSEHAKKARERLEALQRP